jgi:hypothetical protein
MSVASSPSEYRRIPGRSWLTVAGRHSLWLGDDHVLSVWNYYVIEEYKRFYFRDIQALWISRTSRRRSLGLVFGGLVAFFLLIVWVTRSSPLVIFPAFPLLVFSSLFVINWARGPSCECWVQTAVQTERLVCLRRMKTAQRALQLLRRRIEAVQGRLTQEHLQVSAAAPGSEPPARAPEAAGAG